MSEDIRDCIYTVDQRNLLVKGIGAFQNGDYFEAHDLIEEAWQDMSGNPKIFWQSVIQITVSFYHFTSGNRSGATGLARKASAKLKSLPVLFFPEVTSAFLNLISAWEKVSQIADLQELPPDILVDAKKILTPDLLHVG